MTGIDCFVGLGSNLADRHQFLDAALEEIRLLAVRGEVICSTRMESEPLLLSDQPDFLNQVCRFYCELSPLALLDQLQEIEKKAGRVRVKKYGPRTLDLDLILYGEQVIESERLTVPHWDLERRLYLLSAIVELDPGRIHPRTGMPLVDYVLPLAGKQRVRDLR